MAVKVDLSLMLESLLYVICRGEGMKHTRCATGKKLRLAFLPISLADGAVITRYIQVFSVTFSGITT